MKQNNISYQRVSQNFLNELDDAQLGKKTSFPFILNKIPGKPMIKEGEIFQVLVIGGTIFRKALIKKEGKSLVILERDAKYQPPFKHRKDLEFFVDKEISDKVSVVALNFAYPLRPVFENGRLDGILVSGTKGNVFDDLVGKKVGHELENYLNKKLKKKIKISVANDTICLLLAGLTRAKWEDLIGGVIGTGMNFAFFIDKNTAVNLESANFDKFPQTPEARLIDEYSANPGKSLFEKEVAGAYLYKHFNLIRELKELSHPSIQSTEDLDRIAQQNIPGVSAVAKELLQNSAELVATQIAGIMKFKHKSLTFVIEGSLFWLSNGYRGNVKKCLAEICPEYKARFVKIPDSTIIGAAKLIA